MINNSRYLKIVFSVDIFGIYKDVGVLLIIEIFYIPKVFIL